MIGVGTIEGIPVLVGLPWRPQPSRLAAKATVEGFYREEFGIIPLAAEDDRFTAPRPFNLAAARNTIVDQAFTSEGQVAAVVILNDADTIPEAEPVREAVRDAIVDDLVHLPYHLYRLEDGHYIRGAQSGVLVMTPKAWLTTNGQDEHFEGWGFEDSAFALAQTTLNGPLVRHKGTVLALGHVDAPRDQVTRNRTRYRSYEDAYGIEPQMRWLVSQW